MVILPDWEYTKINELVDKKDACIGNPSTVAITMLNNLPKYHKEREGRENRNQPKCEVIDGGPRIYCEMQNRKCGENRCDIPKAHHGRDVG